MRGVVGRCGEWLPGGGRPLDHNANRRSATRPHRLGAGSCELGGATVNVDNRSPGLDRTLVRDAFADSEAVAPDAGHLYVGFDPGPVATRSASSVR